MYYLTDFQAKEVNMGGGVEVLLAAKPCFTESIDSMDSILHPTSLNNLALSIQRYPWVSFHIPGSNAIHEKTKTNSQLFMTIGINQNISVGNSLNIQIGRTKMLIVWHHNQVQRASRYAGFQGRRSG